MKALIAFDRWWFASMPPERLATLRVIVGGFAWLYLAVRGVHLTGYAQFPARNFAPVGVTSWLVAPLSPALVYFIYAVTLLAGFAFVAGARFRFSGPLFAAGFLWVTTYRNSWGMIFHTDNLVALHLGALAFAPAAMAWSYDARGRQPPKPAGCFGWPVRTLCCITIVSYVLAGVAKVRNAGWEWSEGGVLREHVAFDALRKIELGSFHSPVGAWLVEYEWPFHVLGLLTLVLELGAPLALLNRRVRTAWVLGVWSFHLGVIALMAITFAYPVTGAAFASFFAVERLWSHPRAQRLVPWFSRFQPKREQREIEPTPPP